MFQSVTLEDFKQAFKLAGHGDEFSDEGFKALFMHFDNSEEWFEELIERDVLNLCSEYSEQDSLEDLVREYPDVFNSEDDYDFEDESTIEDLEKECRNFFHVFIKTESDSYLAGE